MIKYVDLPGYKNLGELGMFSHFYQFMQSGAETPITILLHAYEGDIKAFKGYLLHANKTFQSVPITPEERSTLEPFVGTITQVNLDELVAGSVFQGGLDGYKSVVAPILKED